MTCSENLVVHEPRECITDANAKETGLVGPLTHGERLWSSGWGWQLHCIMCTFCAVCSTTEMHTKFHVCAVLGSLKFYLVIYLFSYLQ